MLACLPQNIMKLLADAATAPLVKELIKHGSGIARLENERWLKVSAPQSKPQRLRLRGMLACSAEHHRPARRRNDRAAREGADQAQQRDQAAGERAVA